MATVITIRDVPEEVRDALAAEARENGQSLQAFLLGVLHQQAAFHRNRQLIVEVSNRLAHGGGADESAPDAADIIAAEREARTASLIGVEPGEGRASA